MANSAGICHDFKVDIMMGVHNLTTGTGDTLKMALYSSSASIDPTIGTYTGTGELANGNGYTTGGASVTNGTSPARGGGTTAYWTPSANVAWTFTASQGPFDCAYLYNTSKSNKGIAAFTFSAQTVNGTFTLTMPTNNGTTGLVRIG